MNRTNKTKKCPKCGERMQLMNKMDNGKGGYYPPHFAHRYSFESLFSDDYWNGKKTICSYTERIEG